MSKPVLLLMLGLVKMLVIGCATYNLDISTTPPTEGVRIYHNDRYLGRTNADGKIELDGISSAASGLLQVYARYNGFKGSAKLHYEDITDDNVVSSSYSFRRGHNWSVNFGPVLRHVGDLIVTSAQNEVKIYLNDDYWGELRREEILRRELRPDVYVVTAKKDGFRTDIKNVRVYDDETSRLNFDLEKIPLTYGFIRLTSNEDEVDVYIDGKLEGKIPGGEIPFNKRVPTGVSEIMVKKDFFSPSSIRINLKENEIISYNFELVRATGGSELAPTESRIHQTRGNLTVVTERNDLIIFIDGDRRIPPVQFTDIPAGFYNIRVTDDSGLDDTIRVTVQDKRTTIVDLDEKFPK